MHGASRVSLSVAAGLVLSQSLIAQDTEQKFFTVNTKHYVIETNISEEYTQEIADLMESIHAAYQGIFRKVKPKSRFASRIRRVLQGCSLLSHRAGQAPAHPCGQRRVRQEVRRPPGPHGPGDLQVQR